MQSLGPMSTSQRPATIGLALFGPLLLSGCATSSLEREARESKAVVSTPEDAAVLAVVLESLFDPLAPDELAAWRVSPGT